MMTKYQECVSRLLKASSIPRVGMTPSDKNANVDVLMAMFEQYCDSTQTTKDGRPMYDHCCMTAGEDAADVLLNHGKISLDQLVRP